MSEVRDFFGNLWENVKEPITSYVVNYFRETPSGEVIERKVTSTIISDYLKNPIVIIVLVVLGYLVFKGLRKG